jgi:hypothetical protein
MLHFLAADERKKGVQLHGSLSTIYAKEEPWQFSTLAQRTQQDSRWFTEEVDA